MREKIRLSEEDLALLERLYRQGIRYTDSQIEKLINALKARSIYNNTLIIITSDHGEEFQEHGKLLHEQPYEESCKIPMLIKFPESRGAQMAITTNVELIDIFPTVLSELGMMIPEKIQGKSIRPADLSKADPYQHIALMQDKMKRHIYALRHDRYKIIYNINTQEYKFYDLQSDPGEKNDIAQQQAQKSMDLRDRLKYVLAKNEELKQEILQKSTSSKKVILSEEEIERLRSLGYVK